MRPITLFAALWCSCICLFSYGQQPAGLTKSLDSLLQTTLPRPFSGVVLISRKGHPLYMRSIGFADTAKKVPLKPEDHFAILSNSKQITAVIVLREFEQGRLRLHVPVRHYLPELTQSWADTVTIHQLLNHTSGVVRMSEPPAFKPGSRYQYSNEGYSLLAAIAARTSGKPYRKLVGDLFRKCGMKESYFPDAITQKQVTGFRYKADGSVAAVTTMIFRPEDVPFGGLVSTAGDMDRWNTSLHGGKLLRPATYRLMTSYNVKNQHPVFGEKPVGYGYGLRINNEEIPVELGHTGYLPDQGFTAVNLYYPASGTSVIVLENQCYDDFSVAYYFEKVIRDLLRQSESL